MGLDHSEVDTERFPKKLLMESKLRLSLIYKRERDFSRAINLWEQVADLNHLHAFVELAKYYEHQAKNYRKAIQWTRVRYLISHFLNALMPNVYANWDTVSCRALTGTRSSCNSDVIGLARQQAHCSCRESAADEYCWQSRS